ncbi:PAS domain-containing sensor histidine kinase [Cellulophaga sp. Z1A5H]|uniref:PAS domain-containing sensor histidine kinase n=1 Tax=Cellulophaga sp. Z1A5H TaxID=2687291 RepID=UPI0013FD4293|nr:PAS domain-containing sensor histidine kinase [Cellulophaga sp. Z1A5H]
MDNKEVSLLKRALDRQVKARKQAESILEAKSKELYDTTRHLQEVNDRLEDMLSEKSSELNEIFVNIVDPYVVMDLSGEIIKMNKAAREFLECDPDEKVSLSSYIHKDYIEYTYNSLKSLIEVGTIKNYRPKFVLKNGAIKHVEVNGSIIYDRDRKPIGAQGIIRDISQDSEVKELLANQKKQLDIIVENSPLGIILTDNERIIKANEAVLTLLGYSNTEIKKHSLDSISCPKNVSEAKNLMKKMDMGELDNFSVIKTFVKKDGKKVHTKTAVSAVKNQIGEIDYKVAIIEDITKELEAEEQLKASENRLSSLIANLHTGILVEDEHRNIVLANKMLCNFFDVDIPPHRLVGVDCFSAMKDHKGLFKNPDFELERIDKIIQNKTLTLSDELEMADGRILERDYIPIFNKGVYNGHLWTYTDVTISRNYKRNLEVQKEKYSSIIANMNLGLLEVNIHEVIQTVNQSFCTMSGYTEKELLGKKATDLIKITNTGTMPAKSEKRLKGESDSYEVEVIQKDGSTRHWFISGAPRYSDSGKVIGSLGIHLDITVQKQLELQKETLVKELEKSNVGLQEYAHIVSHDLKSPLRSISALCTWLNEDYQDKLDDNGKYNLAMMQEKVEAMDNLIDGILKYSTINNDTIENTSVDVNEVIKEITDIIYTPDHVKIVVTNKLPTIFADRTKIHQLIQNFLSNAVVHIERENGLVEIGCIETKTHWQFSIKDNGVGIPKEYHEKIFKIFQSVGNKERSTGIGLSIVKKIIDLYEGRVWLESEIGVGTTFFFTLKK